MIKTSQTSNRPHTAYPAIRPFDRLRSCLERKDVEGLSSCLSALNQDDVQSLTQQDLHILMFKACSTGQSQAVESLLTSQPYTPEVLGTIVVDALERGAAEFAFELLTHGRLPREALHASLQVAASRGADLDDGQHLVTTLIELGADPSRRDATTGRTSLETARSCSHPSHEVIRYLEQITPATDRPVTQTDMTQAQRSKAFQDLAGKNAVMPHIKSANAKDQIRAIKESVKGRGLTRVTVLDVGGGDGLTAPVLKAIRDEVPRVDVLNVEPESKYEAQYRSAHEAAGIHVAGVLTKGAEALKVADVKSAFPEGVDVVFASHSMYFELDAIWRASQGLADLHHPEQIRRWVEHHPLTKYLDSLAPGGAFVVTLGSAQELGATRTMASGNHRLSLDADPTAPKDPAQILGCFKNMQLFAKHFECWKPHYEEQRHCTLDHDCFASVVRIPLGKYDLVLNTDSGLYELRNPFPQPLEHFHAPEVFRFYSSWPTPGEAVQMSAEERQSAFERQRVFLNLLPVFTAGPYLCLRDETISIRKTDRPG